MDGSSIVPGTSAQSVETEQNEDRALVHSFLSEPQWWQGKKAFYRKIIPADPHLLAQLPQSRAFAKCKGRRYQN